MQTAVFFAVLLCNGAFASSVEQGVTPIQKVIQMMDDMMVKGKEEKEKEAKLQAEFATFCKDTAWDKSTAIKRGKASIEDLSADIMKADSDVLVAVKELGALNEDITTWSQEIKKQKDLRASAHATFQEVHKDYTQSIDAVERALSTLKAGTASMAQTSLLQLSSMGRIPAKDRKRIMSFLQTGLPTNALLQDAEAIEQPQAKEVAYSSSSGTVIEMVEGLGDKFAQERGDLEKKEANDAHTFDMMMQDLNTQVSRAKEEADSKTALKAKREQDKAEASGDLADTKATLAEDQKALADLTTECEQKALEVEQNQKVRQEELDAIQEAKDIMSSDAVSGLIQMPRATTLAQLRSSSSSSVQQAVAAFLQDKAQRTNSRVLSLLAVKVSSDPFKKVTKMIKDMIAKLIEEANEEAEHKGFCDAEMSENKQTRDTKTEEAAMLKATSEELSADIAKLANEITELGEGISALDASVTDATKRRATEKAQNTQSIADGKAGKEAVGKAIQVLKSFYEKAGSAALLQLEKPYKGMEGGGVLGMLEVCESDFARLESETTSAETQAAKAYEEFMADSADEKSTKSTDMKHKEGSKQEKESALATASKDLTGVQEELDAAMAYYEKLKPSCVDAGETYEERVERRKNEIESLKEALKILNGDM